MENTSQINLQTHYSRASCAFNINDPPHKKNGIQMTEDMLPAIEFDFFQDTTSPRASRIIDVEIKSYWSPISRSRQGFPWLGESSEPLQTAPLYSNLCQSVALKIPSNLTERAPYVAELDVDLQNLDSDPHISLIVDSPLVSVTPRVSSSHYSDLVLPNTPGLTNPYLFPSIKPLVPLEDHVARKGKESDKTRPDNDSFRLKLEDKMVPDHRQRLDPYAENYLNSPLTHPREQDAPKPKQGKSGKGCWNFTPFTLWRLT
jgi:hypothetical protein